MPIEAPLLIYIDTSAFERQNYAFGGERFKKFADHAAGGAIDFGSVCQCAHLDRHYSTLRSCPGSLTALLSLFACLLRHQLPPHPRKRMNKAKPSLRNNLADFGHYAPHLLNHGVSGRRRLQGHLLCFLLRCLHFVPC